MKRVKLIAALVLIIGVVIIIFQNRGPVELKLLFATVSMPRAMFVFLVAAAGFGSGFLLGLHQRKRAKSQEAAQERP